MLKKIMILNTFIFTICFSRVLVDSTGRVIEIPENIERVISTVPSNTEIIVDMGLVDLLIGVDSYSEKVDERLKGKGFLRSDDLNEEKIVELMPDLVISSHHNLKKGKESLKFFDEVGIPVYVIKSPKSLSEVADSVTEIGEVLNRKDEAQKLKDRFIEELKMIVSNRNLENKRVYFEILDSPIYTTGAETFLNDALESIGGRNIFKSEKGWISPPLESILEKNPEIILVGEDRKYMIEEILKRVEWQEVDAIKNRNVYFVDESINRPSTRVLKALRALKEVLKR
ncbi:MAG: ABC transporter substrate-binding protein, partial [Cetobacterium sp.]|uniref:ABC transporter substrate-binding protein n=1 Tax=Cetobacterium sp. ZOR0034 TaxID=1339239 RepID=UPI000648FB36|nr:helical backbone metal receptor [Cetobacterium sp. ZOR0034]